MISLHFYQTILESSPQTRFMFDIDKLLLIDALTFIPGETQDDLMRIAINLLQFCRILLLFSVMQPPPVSDRDHFLGRKV